MRYWRVALIALPGVLWAIALLLAVAASFDPEQYFRYSHQQAQSFVYPTADVIWLIVAFLLELGILYAVLRPWKTPLTLLRASICLALFGLWLWACSFLVIHAPAFILI